MKVKNRIVLPSMGLNYTLDGTMVDRIKNFYFERAKGGAGLLITGPYSIDKIGGSPGILELDENKYIPELKKFNEEIHRFDGVKVAAQLMHMGRYNFVFEAVGQPVSASAVPSKLTGQTPRELTVEEIQDLEWRYSEAAIRVKEAGFDAVEVLACTGYLICQFLSPITNKRTDEYGGSIENRMRFGLEVVTSVRAAVGDDYPIIVRVAGNDFMPGSHTNKESQIFCKELEKAGVGAINVTGGWHETIVPQLTYAVPPGAFLYLARGIKQAVGIPVLASNRLGNPVLGEKAIREGSADMICMGRPLIADPYLPDKAREGRLDDIVSCVGCNQLCFDSVFTGDPVGCMLNPMAGHEGEIEITPAATPLKVTVVGGGPAGMKAAATAAKRGHNVVLFEADQELGGQIRLASSTPGKSEFSKIIASLWHEVDKYGVTVKAGVTATPEIIKAEGPDAVIVATGAEQLIPPIPGLDLPHVKKAWDVIRGDVQVEGKNVVVIGGSATGCETALMVAQQGTIDPDTLNFLFYHQAERPEELWELATLGNKKVTVVDMLPRIAVNVGRTTRWALLKDLRTFHIKTMPRTKVIAVTESGVEVEREGGRETLPADGVILAVGARPRRELYESLGEDGVKLYLIGDSREPRKIIEAIREGFHTALEI